MRKCASWVVLLVLGGLLGCSGGKPTVKPDSVVAKQKLEAITKLADALAVNPNGVDAAVAMDDFNNLAFNPKSEPDIARAILEVYDQRIKGKYRGEIAQQIKTAAETFRLGLTAP